MKIVYVKWEDSHVSGAWVDREDVATWSLTIDTVGYLFAEDNRTISIASSVSKNGNFSGVIKIPRSCIRKMKMLKK